MNSAPGTVAHARITVAFGGGDEPAALIDIAGLLASVLAMPLRGLLLEDAGIFDLAALPFATAIESTGHRCRLSAKALEAAFARKEKIYRRELSARAAAANVSWTFERRRCGLEDIVSNCAAGEFLLIGAGSHATPVSDVVDRIATGARHGAGLALAGLTKRMTAGPVLAIDDGDEAGQATIELAGRIARAANLQLHIAALGSDVFSAKQAGQRAPLLVSNNKNPVHVHPVSGGLGAALEGIIRHLRPGMIVGDIAGLPFEDATVTERLLTVARCPIILLRVQLPPVADARG